MLWLIKLVVWLLCSLPLAWIIYLSGTMQLGPDPGKALADELGLWALRLLLVVLSLRPLREITGRPQFVQVRRLVSLFAWSYATLHFCAGMFYVIGWTWSDLVVAFRERSYITLGLLAWLLMLPLGLTSNRWSQRRLGARWRMLHRLVYPLAILACLHFVWLVRDDFRRALVYGLILLLLLLWRVVRGVRKSSLKRINTEGQVRILFDN